CPARRQPPQPPPDGALRLPQLARAPDPRLSRRPPPRPRRLLIRQAGQRNGGEVLSEGNDVGAVVEDDAAGELARYGVPERAETAEVLVRHGRGGLHFHPG